MLCELDIGLNFDFGSVGEVSIFFSSSPGEMLWVVMAWICS